MRCLFRQQGATVHGDGPIIARGFRGYPAGRVPTTLEVLSMLENAEVGLSASLHLLPACGGRCHRVMCEVENVCHARAIEVGKCWPDIAVQSIVTLSLENCRSRGWTSITPPCCGFVRVGRSALSRIISTRGWLGNFEEYASGSSSLVRRLQSGLCRGKAVSHQRRIQCEGPRPLLPYKGRPSLTRDM
jgi:hypothetical protein